MALVANRYPVRNTQKDVVEYSSFWTSPATPAENTGLTKVCGTGTTSVVRTDTTGKYTVTFTGLPSATLIGCTGIAHGDEPGQAPLIVSCDVSSYSRTAGTVTIEFWDLATPTRRDPSDDDYDKVELTFKFLASTL